jgi:hypothetical protein
MATPERIRRAADALRVALPDANVATLEMLLGQVLVESDFGDGYATPDGSPSNNWGNIYAEGTCGKIPVNDSYEGKAFVAGAAWNCTEADGARQFANLIRGPYSPALSFAAAGDAWGYARALWRDGPGRAPFPPSKRPSYYTGFPPGHKWSLAPKGTIAGSPIDVHYRVLSYAKYVAGGAARVATALGAPNYVRLIEPPRPAAGAGGGGGGGGGGVGAGGVIAVGLVLAGLAAVGGR